MCMEDVRIAREMYSSLEIVVIGAGNTPVVPADPQRLTVRISATSAGTIWVSNKPMAALGQGDMIDDVSGDKCTYRVSDFGDFVTGELHVFSAAGDTLAILTTSLTRR